jgi:hypothetical protein
MDENLKLITEARCPCCGELIPVEIELHAAPLDRYIEYMNVQPCYNDESKSWPQVHLEIATDTKSMLENPGDIQEYHDKMVSIGAASPLTH